MFIEYVQIKSEVKFDSKINIFPTVFMPIESNHINQLTIIISMLIIH